MANYHPLYGDLWNHRDLVTAPLDEVAFYIFLWGNERQRPSGIYQITDEQIVSDLRGRLTLKKVRAYLKDLDQVRHRIIRDEDWLFIPGYLKRQAKSDNLLRAVERDVLKCRSIRVITAFGEKYTRLSRWSVDRLKTLGQPSADGPSIQSRAVTEQSRAVEGRPTVAHAPGSNEHHDPTELTPDELKGLSLLAQARRISLAQAKSELVTAKLREQERP